MAGIAGRLRHRLKFQKPVTTGDGMGGVAPGWTDVATVWGRARPLRGVEGLRAQGEREVVAYEVTIRKPSSWTPDSGMRVLHRGSPLYVDAVLDEREGGLMVLQCVGDRGGS